MKYFIELSAFSKGGHATVHHCRDSFGTRYAAKVIPNPRRKLDRVRLHNEIRHLRLLQGHPKIARLYDVLEREGDKVLVMQMYRGGDALGYLRDRDVSENTVASITRGVLRGLCFCHENGVVHRDVKPANVMLTDASEDAEVVLIDFGLSMEAGQEAPVISGTPHYMSPEALRLEVAPAADVWALGVSVHQMLSGRLPFGHGVSDPSALYRAIFSGEFDMRSGVWARLAVSDTAKDFVARCLARDPAARPSARELLDHPWLARGDCTTRFDGEPLNAKYHPGVFDATTLHVRWDEVDDPV